MTGGDAGMAVPHVSVAIVGGGQAGLSVSAHLKAHGVEHVVFEKNRVGHAWEAERWDSFCLVTPNWQCRLPGYPYVGASPMGFMARDEIVAYVRGFAEHIGAPVREGVGVSRVSRDANGLFRLSTSEGAMTAEAVVLAVSAYHMPKTPAFSAAIDSSVTQLHSSGYRNPTQLREGAVAVVGSGQSGCQIAEDLHLAARKVHLVVGRAPRCPRVYRGRDAVEWLDDLGQYDLPVDRHPKGAAVRGQANHYLTGRDGGRDIDLRRFAREGMSLHGRLVTIKDGRMVFADDLSQNLDAADAVYNGICGLIDRHIAERDVTAPEGVHYLPVWSPEVGAGAMPLDLAAAGVTTVIWATGFQSDWSFVDLPFLDATGYPDHVRGVTREKGLYVVGMPWLYTWGSGRFVGVGRDAEHISASLAATFGAGRQAATAARR